MAAGGSDSDRRRAKAALFLACCGLVGIAPHWLPPGRSLVPAITLATLLGGYSLRTVLLQAFRRSRSQTLPQDLSSAASVATAPASAVDVVVAARDEQAVIARLVERIAALRWPEGQLTLWVVDDGSDDRTPELLAELQGRHPFLRVLRRPRDAGGGKSGALNLVLQQLSGRWMLVLDADADLQSDVLERLVPWAEAGGWAAVQLRKAVANAQTNLLTSAQAMEMAFDAMIQEGRLANGGVAELRGNGQLLSREALLKVGGFNEDTVTDDLDLSFRFLLESLPIGVLWDPPVQEEAVLTLPALWRQRQRWAEGGLQRFFDYGPGLVSERLSFSQKLDLTCFFLLQYVLPVVASADLIGTVLTRTAPTMWPFSIVALALSGLAIATGCRRPSEGPALPAMNLFSAGLGILYLVHWFVVIPWVTLKMALLPKKLVWVKTLHLGQEPGDPLPAADPLKGAVDSDPELASEASHV
ncbi:MULTISPECIES: glycosyltransferase family 2 protein [unclassified Cyanobium]|uniref:glycosyltransferase n=1 Tax=unclassified Cyanobium TaxID=2627006 RepID=UPI0020CDE3F6|nr:MULTISPECIES: glycosyltransferase family 2 protein [unclassified Cyanobium]MCP9834384.1 glycosyltransferase family 2 protein [Cyanobium sp. La Preciosa 7G6]MCP9937244.1 glycosyltransferase family 2 protein [Cyanobium sp. Aljojuca 7A6]